MSSEPTNAIAIPTQLRHDLEERRVVVVAGAGVSIASTAQGSVASWPTLIRHGLERILEEEEAASIRETLELVRGGSASAETLIRGADQIRAHFRERPASAFRNWLNDTVGSMNVTDRSLIDAIDRLGCAIVTTNYDTLIEDTTGRSSLFHNLEGAQTLLRDGRRGDRFVYHLHGIWRDPQSVVLDSVDYTRILEDQSVGFFRDWLSNASTLLFVGVGEGMNDPHFARIREFWQRYMRNADFAHYRLALRSERSKLRAEHLGEPVEILAPCDTYAGLHRVIVHLADECVGQCGTGVPSACRPTFLLGREAELNVLERLVIGESARGAWVTGPARYGKSRIVQELLHRPRVAEEFREHRHLLAAGRWESPNQAHAEIMRIFRRDPRESLDAVASALRGRRALILADLGDCDVKAEECVPLAALRPLLGIPSLALVVASRRASPALELETVQIRAFDREAIAAVLSTCPLPGVAGRDVLEAVWNLTLGRPQEFAGLCSDLWGAADLREVRAILSNGTRRRTSRRTGAVPKSAASASPRPNRVPVALFDLLKGLPGGIQVSDVAAILGACPSEDDLYRLAYEGSIHLEEQDAELRLSALPGMLAHPPGVSPSRIPVAAERHFLNLALLGERVGRRSGREALLVIVREWRNCVAAIGSNHARQRGDVASAFKAAAALLRVAASHRFQLDATLRLVIERAMDVRGSPDAAGTLIRYGDLCLKNRDFDGAGRVFERVRRDPPTFERRLDAILGLAALAAAKRDLKTAQSHLTEARRDLDLRDPADRPERIEANWHAAQGELVACGDINDRGVFADADALFGASQQLVSGGDDLMTHANARLLRARIRLRCKPRRDLQEIDRYLREALQEYDLAGLPYKVATCHRLLATLRLLEAVRPNQMSACFVLAERLLRAARQRYRLVEAWEAVAHCQVDLARVARLSGDIPKARSRIDRTAWVAREAAIRRTPSLLELQAARDREEQNIRKRELEGSAGGTAQPETFGQDQAHKNQES